MFIKNNKRAAARQAILRSLTLDNVCHSMIDIDFYGIVKTEGHVKACKILAGAVFPCISARNVNTIRAFLRTT